MIKLSILLIATGMMSLVGQTARSEVGARRTRSGDSQSTVAKEKNMPKGIIACKKDMRRFCKNVQAGDGRIGKCLYDHLESLSKVCQTYASHGGTGHELESLQELDKLLAK